MQTQQDFTAMLGELDFGDLNQWLNLQQTEEKNPNYQVSTMRWLLRNRERNGLDAITKKIGKSWLIHQEGLAVWTACR